MKIFSSFDTNLSKKLVQEARQEYGPENVIFVRRFFIFLIMRIFVPGILWLLFCSLLLRLVYGAMQEQGGFYDFLRGLVWVVVAITGVYFIWKALKVLIDYYMDFTIITPREISCYNQRGLFNTSTRTLDISKVKTVVVQQSGILKSILNYGSIVFFAEGDQTGEMGDITLYYITNPNSLREQIDHIVVKQQGLQHAID